MVDILMRRRQNNPMLTGEAGVGKTAVVEGFALQDRHRRCAAAAQGREALGARCGPAAGGREHEGRVRAAAAQRHRGGAGLAQADHPVHRRGAHAGGRGRRRGHGRCGQSAEAGAGARHAAHRRGNDVGRVQEAHREGPGAHAPLPSRAGRGARRGQGHPDDARRGLDDGKAPPGAGARRGAGGGGTAVASLHSGPPAARQVGEPARHGLRARRHQPARGAPRGRRLPQAHRGLGDRTRRSSAARPRSASIRPSAQGAPPTNSSRQGETGRPREPLECRESAGRTDSGHPRQAARRARQGRRHRDPARGKADAAAKQPAAATAVPPAPAPSARPSAPMLSEAQVGCKANCTHCRATGP